MPDLTSLRVFDDVDGFAVPGSHYGATGPFCPIGQFVSRVELPLGFFRSAGAGPAAAV